MLCIIPPKDINELTSSYVPLPAGKIRSQIKIAVIDDDGFQEEQFLKNHEFNFKVFNDIEDIRAVEAYDIVICDIGGVGKSFGSPDEGAHIISEIHKFYPTKVLISFSGAKFDNTYNKYFSLCDYNFSKNLDTREWPEKLDNAVQILLDPIRQWKKIRNYLIEHNVSLYKIIQLEDDYVRSILKKTSFSPGEKLVNSLGPHMKEIIIGLAKSLFFRMISGGNK